MIQTDYHFCVKDFLFLYVYGWFYRNDNYFKKIIFSVSVYNPEILNNSTDYYVIRSYNYEKCEYKHHQENMAQPATPEQLVNI